MKVYVMIITTTNDLEYEDYICYPDEFKGVYSSWEKLYEGLRGYITECIPEDAVIDVYNNPEPEISNGTRLDYPTYRIAELSYLGRGIMTETIRVYEIEME